MHKHASTHVTIIIRFPVFVFFFEVGVLRLLLSERKLFMLEVLLNRIHKLIGGIRILDACFVN